MSNHEHVAIFWDYENCSPSCNMTGYDIVNNIREIAHSYGSVTQFKAYLELSEQSSKSTTLRSELQSCGVSLTDCPHNGRKDVADKMMIVDMLTYALDTPAPATIVLISGDRDFVYAVSVLRLRRYRVVLVAPQQTHNSLKSQATTVLDWSTDVLGKEKPSGLPTPGERSQSVHRRSQSSVNSAIAPVSPFAAKSQRRLSFGQLSQRPGVELPQSVSNAKSPCAPTAPLQEAWTPAEERTPDTSRSHSSLLRPQIGIPTPVSEPTSSKLSVKTTLDHAVDLKDPEVDIADLNLHLRNLTNRSSSNHSPSPYIAVTPVEENKIEEQLSVQTAIATAQLDSRVGPTPQATNVQADDTAERSRSRASLSPKEVKEFFRGNDAPLQAPTPDCAPIQPNTRTSEPSKGATAPAAEHLQAGNDVLRPASAPASVVSSEPPSAVKYNFGSMPIDGNAQSDHDGTFPADASGKRVGQPRLDVILAQGSPSPMRAEIAHTMLTPLSARTPPSSTSSLPHPSSIGPNADPAPGSESVSALSWLPPHFANLVLAMQELHAKSPQPNLLRSTVAVLLSQRHKGEYKQAGFADFKAFSTAAEQGGLIVMGGSQGAAWMKLQPEWLGC